MNITIKPKLRANWTITDNEITVGKKTIEISSLTGLENNPKRGLMYVYRKGKYSETYNMDDGIPLTYNPKKDIDDVKKVIEYLLSFFDDENYDISVDEKTGKTYVTKKREYVKPKQFYKKCNTCGHIYCYTQADLNKNKQLSREAAANTFASAFGPAIMSATYNQTANDNKSRIVDYDKCPNCNSVDVISITEEEAENISKNQNTQQAGVSQADELKKFKELFDSGVITQEEFDAKKKEILGL